MNFIKYLSEYSSKTVRIFIVLMAFHVMYFGNQLSAQNKAISKNGNLNNASGYSDIKELITGKWILSSIEGEDTIEVLIKPLAISGTNENPTPRISQDAVRKVSVEDYLKEQLSIGTSMFIFDKKGYRFYRKQEVNQQGTYLLTGTELKLKYPSAGADKIKINEILKIDDKVLIIRTSAQNNIATLTFKRAE